MARRLAIKGAVLTAFFAAGTAAAAPLVQPAQPATSTDPACSWVWQSGRVPGGTFGVWTERCPFSTGLWQPKFMPGLPGLDLTVDADDTGTVLQVFTKPADADVSAILPGLKKAGHVLDDAECVFAPAADELGKPSGTQSFFEVNPTGKLLEKLNAEPDDEIPEPPCGDYGWDPDGIRFFITDTSYPGFVVYVNLGQDGTLFDPATIRIGD